MVVEKRRHIAKTISYRIISTLIGFGIMWWVSGSIKVGAAFGVAELIYKPIQYYIHERVWYKHIKFGLFESKQPEKSEVRIVESVSTEVSETVTTTGPKRLVYTKKTE